ncbi:hypothetical protein NC651_007304 [Populus alba x Populus x berolinensis]|nr:hypothetical protein NC651_007304 [Populus alba x Populus x berolinensis]
MSVVIDIVSDKKGAKQEETHFLRFSTFLFLLRQGNRKKNGTQVKPKLSLAAHTMMSTGLLGLSAPLYLRHAFYNVVLVESP